MASYTHWTTPKLLVFDLDGTLIDSERDLANAVNATLQHFQLAELPHTLIATYIGDGASMLLRRAMTQALGQPPEEELSTIALEYFLDYYREHKLDYTRPYPGVMESLQAIRQREPHLKMAVLTNKPFRPSRQICDALGLSAFFFQNYGGDSFVTKKPDPEGLLQLIGEADVTPEDTIMIGDSDVDVQTARAAKTRVVGCTFGLAPQKLLTAGPDRLAETAADWPSLLLDPQD